MQFGGIEFLIRDRDRQFDGIVGTRPARGERQHRGNNKRRQEPPTKPLERANVHRRHSTFPRA
jgi:hypothetical protein